ncbi:hypothetical protein JRQ81_009657 [Phrynocephalus forsythii]|uniref:Guanine nucleotide-binding protein subunit gamma n=1 Tax=Phrynocephalus forsythii TaxID=171643 RepID=A0A9Q1AS30_9SAUR|nr:hypothetical protein JRQ81_009657 [Phrynocephalus forsythii]
MNTWAYKMDKAPDSHVLLDRRFVGKNGHDGVQITIIRTPQPESSYCVLHRFISSRIPMKGETPVNSTMSIGQARKMVEQLKIEASMCRIKVSKAAADLMTYCDAHACEDPLITPVPTSENPFREKKFFCALL